MGCNAELFSSTASLPKEPIWDSYAKGWHGNGQFTYATFYKNTFLLVVPTVLFTVLSSSLVAYGFSRFDFKLKKPLMLLVIGTLLLPGSVLIIPRYLLFNKLGWLNSFLPFIVPSAFACNSFFIYMLIQFFRGSPARWTRPPPLTAATPSTSFGASSSPYQARAVFRCHFPVYLDVE